MGWIRGHALTVFAVLVVLVSVAYVTKVEINRNDERDARVAQVNTLACALSDYFQTVVDVVAVRGLPGDNKIGAATTDVITSALAIGGPCPEEGP